VTRTVSLAEAAAALAAADRVLLTCHLRPDGDSAGSMSALAALLRSQGKKALVYNPDQVPRMLKWLPHIAGMAHRIGDAGRFDLTVIVDCGDEKLVGDKFPAREVTGPRLVLDHHAAGRPFGELYHCDPGAPAVGALVARIARELGWPLTDDAAPGLYVSLVSDTGSFRYSNTTPEAFSLAAELVERHHVDPWDVAERLGEQATRERYKLLARALDALEVLEGGQLALLVVSDEMVKTSGATWADSEGLVNYARALEGVECGVMLTPAPGGGTRVSLRSRGRKIDAGAICLGFGGGGHKGAAGARLPLPLAEARPVVLAALAAALGSA
jgi:phosphoesterase RecJ-like protein